MAGNIRNLLNVNEVAGTLGIGRDTVKRYLAVLENSFILHSLLPFHSNIRKKLIKMPNLFFLDTGMRNFAVKNFTELSFRPDRGGFFENAIFGELYKNLGVIDQLFYWRTLSKNEVDFILTDDQKVAIKAKLFSDRQLKQPTSLLYLSIFGSIIAFTCYLTLLGKIGADKAAYVTLIIPVIALILSTIFEEYTWTLYAFVGVALILIGNMLVFKKMKR